MRDVQEAYKIYREIVEDEKLMRQIWAIEDAKRNEASALANATRKERVKIIKNLLALDVPMDTIISACGMSEAEIDALSEGTEDTERF